MQLKGERQLENWYREHDLPAVCLLYGEDSYQIEKQTAKLLGLAVSDFADFNLYKADGRTAVRMDELCDAAMALPFMAERKAVLLDDLDLTAQDAASVDKLMQLLKEPGDSCLLLITMRQNQPELKKKSSRSAKLWAACDKAGLCCELPKPSRSDVARAASTRAVKLGSRLDSAAAGLLADYCGGDLLRALQETEKLAAYVGRGDITEQTVSLLVAPVVEARVFDLSARLLQRDLDGALRIVGDLLFLRESPVSILAILSMAFADLYRAAAAKRAGVPTAQAQQELGYFGGSAFRYQKALEAQSRITGQALGDIVLLLAESDSRMKETGANPPVILETTVTRIWGLAAEGAR